MTQEGRYEFNVLPQGAKQSPPSFHNRIKKIIHPLKHAYNYIDDIILMSPTLEEAKEDFISLLKILSKYNLKVKWSKARIFMKEVEFLGAKISSTGKKVGERAQRLTNLPIPRNKGQLRKLLAKIGAFRQFVKNYAIKIAPLSLILRKKAKFYWKSEFMEILERIVGEILNTKLWFPTTGEQLFIHCDAAKQGIGATLRTKVGKLVKCFSQTLTETQSRWSTFEKELFAIRQALKSFEPIVANNSVKVLSDNQAVVKFVKGGGSLADKPLRIREWVSDLLYRQFDIGWIKGKDNLHADCLSRLTEEVLTRKDSIKKENIYVEELYGIDILEVKRKRKTKDHAIKKIKALIDDEEKNEKKLLNDDYSPAENRTENIKIPSVIIQSRDKYNGFEEYLKKAHLAHSGIHGMKLNLAEVSWKNKNKLIEKYVANCQECKRKQNPRKNYLKGLRASNVGEIIAMDSIYIGEQNKAFIAVDLLTGFISLVECENKIPANALDCFYKIVSTVGSPTYVLVDNGSEFKGDFQKRVNELGTTIMHTLPYHPASNPAERKIQDVKKLLKIYREHSLYWVELLLNHQRSKLSGFSPAELVTGRTGLGVMHDEKRKLMDPLQREELAKSINLGKDKRLEKKNIWLRKQEFSKGEKVLVHEGQGDIDIGIVKEKLFHDAYLVEVNNKKFHESADLLSKTEQ